MNTINIHALPEDLNIKEFISNEINDKVIDVEFIYIADFKNAKLLRDFIEVIWNMLWLEQRDISRFILVVDEISNNAIEYWSQVWSFNKLRIKTINNWNSIDINIEIEDAWNSEKHKNALEMETLRAHQLKLWYWKHASIRWRGLFMITIKTVDRLYFKDTKAWWLIVWIKKNIKI